MRTSPRWFSIKIRLFAGTSICSLIVCPAIAISGSNPKVKASNFIIVTPKSFATSVHAPC